MTAVNKLLDKAKEMRSLPSDNALAKALGVTRGSVSNWRHGKNWPDAIACARLADMTGEPLARVLGMVGEERAISREEKAVWHRLAVAAALAVVAALPITSQAAVSAGKFAGNAYYVLRRWVSPRLAIPSRATLSPA